MGTTADKLELLLRTKERQKAYLQEKYPLLDFDTIPFRSYLDLFQGRSYVPGFVGGWKAYGRSNDEDASTRDILPDYSGNGRDIELFNFAFAGMSGYGGYVYDEGNIIVMSLNTDFVTVKDNKIAISNMTRSGTCCYATSIFGTAGQSLTVNVPAYRIKVSGLKEGERIDIGRGFNDGESATWVDVVIPSIYGDGVYDIPAWDFTVAPASETAVPSVSDFRPAVYPKDSTPMNVTIEILPLYPGALVSDGVDDYGQCVKDFVLPDDFTVVAIRKIFNTDSDSALASKSRTAGQGAFIFDINRGGYSYGNICSGAYNAPLFSYQTKTSYNGVVISPGSGMDTEDDTLCLFKKGVNRGDYLPAALYDLRIYDHSLTAEELQTVKDEMMADYENATGGGITDITYVADWDAKGRSNDEEEPMRSQWTDKATGKVINLSNYAYSQMSGWNGYCFDWSRWQSDIATTGGTVIRTQTSIRMTNTGTQPYWTIAYIRNPGVFGEFRIKVSGLKAGAALKFRAVSAGGELFRTNTDGVYTIPAVDTEASDISFSAEGYSENESADLLIEQLPLYPGALVSDGVDDYGESADILTETIGTALVCAELLDDPSDVGKYILNTGFINDGGRIFLWRPGGSNQYAIGSPSQRYSQPPFVLSRVPSSPNNFLNIGGASPAAPEKSTISRIILIKEQLDNAQQEFLKWKVEKEYRDWCKENGYEYAIDEMLNN